MTCDNFIEGKAEGAMCLYTLFNHQFLFSVGKFLVNQKNRLTACFLAGESEFETFNQNFPHTTYFPLHSPASFLHQILGTLRYKYFFLKTKQNKN